MRRVLIVSLVWIALVGSAAAQEVEVGDVVLVCNVPKDLADLEGAEVKIVRNGTPTIYPAIFRVTTINGQECMLLAILTNHTMGLYQFSARAIGKGGWPSAWSPDPPLAVSRPEDFGGVGLMRVN